MVAILTQSGSIVIIGTRMERTRKAFIVPSEGIGFHSKWRLQRKQSFQSARRPRTVYALKIE